MKLPTIEQVIMWLSPVCAIAAVVLGVYGLWGWALLAMLGAIWFEVSL
jgi:hypothetical protein